MACLRVRGPRGERTVAEDVDGNIRGIALDEEIIPGSVTWACGPQDADPVDSRLEAEGIKIGDAIAWVTKKFGIQQCAPCKARQEILNNATKVGWIETLRQIKDTL